MRFFNNDIFSCAGSPLKTLYSPVVNDDGTIDLVPSGVENLQDYIESSAAECDIRNMISRFVNGDLNALNKRQGVYGDFTNMPTTYAEMLQLQIDSQRYFDGLPVDIKEKFNNDSNQFFAQTGSKEWYEIMSSMYPQESKVDDLVIEKEVKE